MRDDYVDLLRDEDEELRQDRLRFAAGMSNFVAVVLGVAFILLMLLLLFSLLNWLNHDLGRTIGVLLGPKK